MRAMRRLLSRGAVATAAAAVAVISLTTGTAYASNRVDCADSSFLEVHAHWSNFVFTSVYDRCFANAGPIPDFDWWVDEISTGNNVVEYQDANGEIVTINKQTDYHPHSAFHVVALTIE